MTERIDLGAEFDQTGVVDRPDVGLGNTQVFGTLGVNELALGLQGAAAAVDFSEHGLVSLTLTSATPCTLTFTAPAFANCKVYLRIQQATAGAATTVVAPLSVEAGMFATFPQPSTALGAYTLYTFFYDGTSYWLIGASSAAMGGTSVSLSLSDVMRLQGGEDYRRSEPSAIGESSFPTLQALGFIPLKGADGKILTADSKQSPGLIWGYGDTSYRYGYRDHDHFLQGINNTGNKTQSGHAGGAGASVTQVTGLGKRHPGVFALATRATNDRSWIWGVPPGIASPMFVSGDGTFEVSWWFNQKFLSSGTETYRVDYGVNSASTLAAALSNSFTAGYNLTNLASGAMFLRVYSNGAAGALVNGTTVLVADTWYRVRLVLDKVNANITMWLCPLDGVETLEAVYTGALPTDGAPYAPFVEAFRSLGTTGATDMQVYVDAWEVNASYANQV